MLNLHWEDGAGENLMEELTAGSSALPPDRSIKQALQGIVVYLVCNKYTMNMYNMLTMECVKSCLLALWMDCLNKCHHFCPIAYIIHTAGNKIFLLCMWNPPQDQPGFFSFQKHVTYLLNLPNVICSSARLLTFPIRGSHNSKLLGNQQYFGWNCSIYQVFDLVVGVLYHVHHLSHCNYLNCVYHQQW